jgi:predicted acylesterase/phospholipase RssA/CRP-like cAMP-binding protein
MTQANASASSGRIPLDSETLQLLRRAPIARNLAPADLAQLASVLRRVRFPAGATIFRHDETRLSMFVILRGRVKILAGEALPNYRLIDYLGRGEHFGEMALLTDGQSPITAEAVVETELLELSLADFQRLLSNCPGFAANLTATLGMRLRRITSGRRRRARPVVIGLVNSTARTQSLLPILSEVLATDGNKLEVLTERRTLWPTGGRYLVEHIPDGTDATQRAELLASRLARVVDLHDRVLIDLTQRDIEGELSQLLHHCEEIWWLIDRDYVATGFENLERLLAAEPSLAPRVHLVWILRENDYYAPPAPSEPPIASLDFKVVMSDDPTRPSVAQRRGVQRLARHLNGTRVGLALSGGGARGMAHLGVIRALDEAGIHFDLIAGTSSGALMGLAYAGGWTADDALAEYKQKLTPPRSLRMVPGLPRWYMVTMFRRHAWEHLLRPYLGDARLEQLQVPFYIVTVDLISGQQVIRERGDVIDAVLASINLPVVSKPILRDGMALVDGGVLNNLPADLLLPRGADLVVGVDVMSKLSQTFAGNTAQTPTSQMKHPGPLETLLRISDVQEHGLSLIQRRACDVLIAPDTSRFEFADFSRADELAAMGYAAGSEMIPQIRQMIADLART